METELLCRAGILVNPRNHSVRRTFQPGGNTPHKGNPLEGDPIKGELPPVSAPVESGKKREYWQLLRDEKTIKERLQSERENVKPDNKMIESLRYQLSEIKSEICNFPPQKNNCEKNVSRLNEFDWTAVIPALAYHAANGNTTVLFRTSPAAAKAVGKPVHKIYCALWQVSVQTVARRK
ncbi:MAG TPA: hypothetical protein VMD27_01945 [Candidatus Aquilonibacter sp.]|nr:hypothetical protein [Candidatus Aquilonibacter sp.]